MAVIAVYLSFVKFIGYRLLKVGEGRDFGEGIFSLPKSVFVGARYSPLFNQI
jgi:hypothetical protein